MDKRLLCLGYGYTARAVAQRITRDGWRVSGTTRSAARRDDIVADGVEPIVFEPGDALTNALKNADAVLISTPPGEKGCPALAAAKAHLSETAYIGYLSTNGVYGDHGGAWVDEDAPLNGRSPRAIARIQAEADWTSFAVERSQQATVFRLPGIYGPGRSTFDTIRAGRARRIFKEGQVFSRAHVDDIAAAIVVSIANPTAGDLFNVADDEPAPPQDVVAFACELIGAPTPALVPIEEADLSEMGRSFYADNKRVSNARMKEALGVQPAYPTYREGLRAILTGEKT